MKLNETEYTEKPSIFSQVKRQNPERSCFLEYDKLYVDHRPFVWNEVGCIKNIITLYQYVG